MEIIEASPELIRAVNITVVRQMAHALMKAGVDLTDDDAVIDAILDAGFGERSVKELWKDAQKAARMFSLPTEGTA